MNLDAFVDQFAKIRPVLEIARAPIDLVDNDPTGAALLKILEHPAKYGPPALCCGFLFFIPLD